MSRKPSRRKRGAGKRAREKRVHAPWSVADVPSTASTLTWRQRLRTILMCAAIEFAVLSGMPMRPEEIRELTQTMNQPKVVHVLPEEKETGEPGSD